MRTQFDVLGDAGPLGAPDGDDDEKGQRFRTIFISDIHLGTPGCQALALLDFLRTHPSDTLYLEGDFVDGWQLRG